MSLLILQRLFLEAVGDIFYFPIWWYTKGALYALRQCLDLLKDGNVNLAPGLWAANLFVPMFGQFDIQGRVISFFMRIVQIIVRTFGLLLWLVFCSALFLVWLLLPIVALSGIVYAI